MICPHEERVLRIAAEFPDDPWLAEHTRACEGCAALREMSCWMLEMDGAADAGGDSGVAARLPSAGQVWWKAQVASREAAARRALRPLRVVESATVAVALVGAGAALVYVLRGLPGLVQEPVRAASQAAAAPVSAGMVVSLALAVFITAVAVHRLLARE